MLAVELMFRNEWGVMASYALPLDVGLHIGRRHQAHRMPQRLQLFEQPLRRSPIAARKLRLAFENLRQHRDPRPELGAEAARRAYSCTLRTVSRAMPSSARSA